MNFYRAFSASAIAAICLTALSGAAHSETSAAAVRDIGTITIADQDFDKYITKSNAVVGLLNTSLRGVESIRRYTSWVDVKRGPTGKERIIYGLYSVSESSARDAVAKAREAAKGEPAIPALDAASREVADTFEALVPILNEAEAYYDRKDYLADNMSGGKALHEKLKATAPKFMEARTRLSSLQEAFKDQLDQQSLARIERNEGKTLRWHYKNTAMLASKAVDLLPSDPRQRDLKDFDAALAAFGNATRDFDNALRDAPNKPIMASSPKDILGTMREMRDDIAKGRANSMSYSMTYQMLISRYNMMVSMGNAFNR